MNPWFQEHKRLYTWKSPGYGSKNQMDFLILNERFRNAVNQCKAYPGADCNSDHVHVNRNMRAKLKRITKTTQKRLQLELQRANADLGYEYTVKTSNKFIALKDLTDV